MILGNGQQTRDSTCVDGIVRGIILAAECDKLVGEAANLARRQDVSISTICELILKKLDRQDLEPVYVHEGRPADIDKSTVMSVRPRGCSATRRTLALTRG